MAETAQGRSAAELLGVFEIPSRGRGRLVATAVEIFYRHGFNAVGIDRVIDEAGVTKTTFYKHFKSKNDLMIAAVEMRDAWELGAWRRAARTLAGDGPRAQLLALFDVLDVWFNDAAFGGCLFLNVASEFPNPNNPVHRAAARHKLATWERVRDLAAEAGDAEPEVFADRYTIAFEGALVLRQVYGRNDAARTARPLIEQLIRERLGGGGHDPGSPAARYPVPGVDSEPRTLRVVDGDAVSTRDWDGALAAHGGDSVFGVAVAFRMLQAAARALGEGGALRRDALCVTSGHPGPGVRDAVEYLTGCVSRGRYRVAAGGDEPGCRRGMRFEWEVADGARAAALRLREGFVPDELYALLDRRDTPEQRPEDDARFASLKAELAEAVWREPLDGLFEVALRAAQ